MLIGIRVDASFKMGTGHAFRMLTLARKLESNGHQVVFICRKLGGNLINFIEESFNVISLPEPEEEENFNTHCAHGNWLEVPYETEIAQVQDVVSHYLSGLTRTKLDWLVIDHYALDERFQVALRPLSCSILQIDDLADRVHDVDMLLDQNYYSLGNSRYDAFLPSFTKRLCGPKYALLRDEFRESRKHLPNYTQRLSKRKVVLFFGGIDWANETSKALLGLLSVESGDHLDVIIGMNNPHKQQLEALCAEHKTRVTLHVQVKNMMDYFSDAYLYVGAVGATTWERCVLALPGIVCSVADNQTQLAKDLHDINGHCYLGLNSELSSQDYALAYQRFISQKELLLNQSSICGDLVDGKGCERVVEHLEEISKNDNI
ncbi:UDP-2,4-diacetamido-2,4,6-trideoxy-beta-L-altropyranose hydrolase [Aliivibrio fischeri]|uniref:UDP-2,4-diacetamido-2,4, 6-trideoxy-beta-L-altropyranose hydrolase n=1 Tax=Aliivibrio fischeri TaxID=668 RepID=UPI001354CD7E|nr:UDP-2,4-diacetamido-2,4,6-trideoxy-beta-L-altropyranose hydrolase [Aliivibrio fischeri]